MRYVSNIKELRLEAQNNTPIIIVQGEAKKDIEKELCYWYNKSILHFVVFVIVGILLLLLGPIGYVLLAGIIIKLNFRRYLKYSIKEQDDAYILELKVSDEEGELLNRIRK
ncbi:MAG: hypothetical protein LUH21_06995 [Clostridiales bacterium]|nr:hypothetical protein [Clostridiales bacterium]